MLQKIPIISLFWVHQYHFRRLYKKNSHSHNSISECALRNKIAIWLLQVATRDTLRSITIRIPRWAKFPALYRDWLISLM